METDLQNKEQSEQQLNSHSHVQEIRAPPTHLLHHTIETSQGQDQDLYLTKPILCPKLDLFREPRTALLALQAFSVAVRDRWTREMYLLIQMPRQRLFILDPVKAAPQAFNGKSITP